MLSVALVSGALQRCVEYWAVYDAFMRLHTDYDVVVESIQVGRGALPDSNALN